MKKNMGSIDRIIRIVIAIIITGLYFGGVITGVWATVLLVLAGALLLTSVVSFCGLYTLFGFSTCPVKPIQK